MSRLLLSSVAALASTALVDEDAVNLLQTATLRREHVAPRDQKKKCVVKGDPHVKLWNTPDSEGAAKGLYGTYADYWLVKTPELKVMGRVGGVEHFDMGVVKGVAVSGSLVGDKILEIPTENNGAITFDGAPITSFPWSGGGLSITVGTGPNLNQFGGSKPMDPRTNTYNITLSSAEIILNQGVFQHLEINADASLVANDAGQCNNECTNFFECQDGTCDPKVSLFSTKHATCGEKIMRVPCNSLRLKLAEKDCKKQFKGQKTAGNAIHNCIEDCCTDRNQCPDRGEGDGRATCVVFGDPHIKGFDASYPNVHSYDPMGTHWLVNSKFIQVQAQYITDKGMKAGVRGIAVTGDIVGEKQKLSGRNPVLYFPPVDGPLAEGGAYLDGKKVFDCDKRNCNLHTPYEDPNRRFKITYGDAPDIQLLLSDQRPVPNRSYVFTVDFAHGAKIMIHQGLSQNIHMSIDGDLLQNCSGECGNFNGDDTDDHHPSVDNTTCASPDTIFIPNGKECYMANVDLARCHKRKYLNKFKQVCQDALKLQGLRVSDNAKTILKACQMDCCLGGPCPKNTKQKVQKPTSKPTSTKSR